LVEVKPRSVLVGGQHHVRQAVAVEIAGRHTAAVVEIAVGEDVQLRGILDPVLEPDSSIAGGKPGEEMSINGGRRSPAARRFLLLFAAGACGEVQRGKEIAEPQPRGRVLQIFTAFSTSWPAL